MVESLFAGVPSVQVHTVVLPFYFVTQPDDNESHLELMGCATFCLTMFEHFYYIFLEISFDMNMK